MKLGHVPLFWVSVAFAVGCLLGLDRVVSWPFAVAIAGALGIAWFFARGEKLSILIFYLFVASSALAHTLILAATIASNDVRQLPTATQFASTQWRGRVVEDPQATPHRNRRALDRTSFVVELVAWRATGGQLFSESSDIPWSTASGRVSCTVLGPAQDIRAGDEIEFAAALMPFDAPLLPGQLDLRSYEGQRDIYREAVIHPLDWRRLNRTESGEPSWAQTLSFVARDWAYQRLQWGIEDDPRTADFLAGMLIGYRQEIPADIEQNFRVTGTLHVFAISGQNIAEMAVVAIVLLQLCGLVRWRWAWLLAPIVLVYCLLAGSPASAVRATVMALAILAAWRLGRPLNAFGCWSIAALAMMCWDPRVLLDPGAQLSFGVVLGLILLSPPIYRVMVTRLQHDAFLPSRLLTTGQKREEHFWAYICALLAASVAATLVSEPITAVDFHQITPISIVANLLVVPLAGLITIVGTVSIAFSLLSHTLAALCNNSNWLLAKIMIWLVAFFAHEPGAAMNVADLRALQEPSTELVVAPLQDSACLFIKDEGHTWLVDTGREAQPPSPPGRLLQFYGINRLDGLVLAQPTTPDNGGAMLMARQFRPRRVVVPLLENRSGFWRDVPVLAKEDGVSVTRWSRGNLQELGHGVSVEVLGPAADSAASREDDRALVLLIHANGGALLWAGRLDAEGQEELMESYPNLHTDVVALGGDTPPNAAWMRSLGAKFWLRLPSRQRHLNSPTPGEVEEASCEVWPLEETGAVTVHFTGGENPEVELTPFVGVPADRD